MSDHNDIGWIDLRGALIWVLTQILNALADKFTASSSVRHRLLPSHWKRGWHELRSAIAKEKIRVAGEPFDQHPTSRNMATRSIGLDPRRRKHVVLSEQVAKMELDVDLFELKPSGWALIGGLGWRYVEIAKADLAAAFREGDNALVSIQRAGAAVPRRVTRSAPKYKLILG